MRYFDEQTIDRFRNIESTTYTYLIADGNWSHFKVGKSVDPERRLRELRVANPTRLVLVGMVARDVEVDVHRALENVGGPTHGEWYLNDVRARAILFPFFGIESTLALAGGRS